MLHATCHTHLHLLYSAVHTVRSTMKLINTCYCNIRWCVPCTYIVTSFILKFDLLIFSVHSQITFGFSSVLILILAQYMVYYIHSTTVTFVDKWVSHEPIFTEEITYKTVCTIRHNFQQSMWSGLSCWNVVLFIAFYFNRKKAISIKSLNHLRRKVKDFNIYRGLRSTKSWINNLLIRNKYRVENSQLHCKVALLYDAFDIVLKENTTQYKIILSFLFCTDW